MEFPLELNLKKYKCQDSNSPTVMPSNTNPDSDSDCSGRPHYHAYCCFGRCRTSVCEDDASKLAVDGSAGDTVVAAAHSNANPDTVTEDDTSNLAVDTLAGDPKVAVSANLEINNSSTVMPSNRNPDSDSDCSGHPQYHAYCCFGRCQAFVCEDDASKLAVDGSAGDTAVAAAHSNANPDTGTNCSDHPPYYAICCFGRCQACVSHNEDDASILAVATSAGDSKVADSVNLEINDSSSLPVANDKPSKQTLQKDQSKVQQIEIEMVYA